MGCEDPKYKLERNQIPYFKGGGKFKSIHKEWKTSMSRNFLFTWIYNNYVDMALLYDMSVVLL